jgi:hypothetical protein
VILAEMHEWHSGERHDLSEASVAQLKPASPTEAIATLQQLVIGE